jgi:hypothetical protein
MATTDKYLVQKRTARIYPYRNELSERKDMILCGNLGEAMRIQFEEQAVDFCRRKGLLKTPFTKVVGKTCHDSDYVAKET